MNNTEIKHKQHYVFKAYLDHWTTNGKIWCCRKNKIFHTNTVNVAQERDFYRVKELNADEEKFMSFFLYNQSKETRATVMNHIQLMRKPINWKATSDLLRYILEHVIFQGKELPIELINASDNLQKLTESTVNNFIEDVYSDDESKAVYYFKQIMDEDLTFFYNPTSEQGDSFCDSKQRFIHFLCSQHFRTKSMRERWAKGMDGSFNNDMLNKLGIDNDKLRPDHLAYYVFWYVESHITDMLYQNNAHLTLIINNTSEPFITSDQPIINIKANYRSISDAPDELIFYYPISPKHAVLLNDNNSDTIITVSEDDVRKYNAKIMRSAFENIFSNDCELFKKYHF